MLQRCRNSNLPAWKNYGGRGITVCDRWDPAKGGSFDSFLADMGERPKGTSLDRWPNPDGNYEPGNCRWATRLEQAANKSLLLRRRTDSLAMRQKAPSARS